ncbi:MAG: PhzF family phenazine biosynthesis protein [Corynebacterium sp.]|uniref:PhzF family phenazine biosynthesis protein n=1 Tax=Corynebacterium sp. TaxID=1720 RepID=UPI002648FFCD|nr:PhzF family phenazine biosynthesis protein [Corynebacterium sp.]MDN5719089.1 PhzF family phenazine biosynthesis protein [Corynebacterium sp.]
MPHDPARQHRFAQVDVFSAEPYRGNPVAVILDADDLDDEQMQRIACWTNLSETTFVLSPSTPDPAQDAPAPQADYRVRIFTPEGELPFAGHPTLGTAHAWLEVGGEPHQDDVIIQECAAGLVEVHRNPGTGALSFTAPPTTRTGPLEEEHLARISEALRIDRSLIVDHQWADNGPGWAAVQLPHAQDVLDLRPDFSAHPDLKVGVFGLYPDGAACRLEIRAFVPGAAGAEDPVTGSLNASVGQWLLRSGKSTEAYTAAQGTVLGRTGRISVTPVGSGRNVLVGGATTTLFHGHAEFPQPQP